MEVFKDFFACRIVPAADQRYPEFIQRVFHRQKYLCLKSSTTWKHSKTFSPAELSQLQINDILNLFKDFFAGRKVLVPNHQQHGNIQIPFRLQNCLGRKSSISQNYAKTFFACRFVLAANQRYPEVIQRLFHRQKTLSLKSSTTWKHSKTFSPAELSWTQIINIPKLFKDFFACRIVLAADQGYPEYVQRLFRLQNCLSRRSSIPRKHSKTFSPVELSQPQIIDTPKTFKDFFACRIVSAADHRYPENIQRLFHLHNCLSRKSSTTWKHSKTFSPAELSQPQINDTLILFKEFFTGRKVLVSNHQQHGNIQRLFRLHNCLGRKSSISQNFSKTFLPAELSQPQINDTVKLFKDFFNC